MFFCRNHSIRLVNSTIVSLFLIVFRERVFEKATVIRQLVISLLISLNGCVSVIHLFKSTIIIWENGSHKLDFSLYYLIFYR